VTGLNKINSDDISEEKTDNINQKTLYITRSVHTHTVSDPKSLGILQDTLTKSYESFPVQHLSRYRRKNLC
jgi:hypothetical protein